MRYIIAFLLILFLASTAFAYSEKEYQKVWCEAMKGKPATLSIPQGKRFVDCMTDYFAIEIDFAPKYYEAIGQALIYAFYSERQPGILLILEKEGDEKYLSALLPVAKGLHIKVWTITPLILERMKEGNFVLLGEGRAFLIPLN